MARRIGSAQRERTRKQRKAAGRRRQSRYDKQRRTDQHG